MSATNSNSIKATRMLPDHVDRILAYSPSQAGLEKIDLWMTAQLHDVEMWRQMKREELSRVRSWVVGSRNFVGSIAFVLGVTMALSLAFSAFFWTNESLAPYAAWSAQAIVFSVMWLTPAVVLFLPLAHLWHRIVGSEAASNIWQSLRTASPEAIDMVLRQAQYYPEVARYIHDVKAHRNVLAHDLEVATWLYRHLERVNQHAPVFQ